MKKVLFTLLILISSFQLLFAGETLKHRQNGDINYIIGKEKSPYARGRILSIINYIDDTYSNLYYKLKNGKKIVIFFDPAHGKDKTERWRGHTTNRYSVTGKPEEYYSILFSRKMYNLLKGNKHIKVVTCDEFQQVLDGKSDSYHFLRFKTTVSLAKKFGAFMVIAEHLNNVSMFKKADGIVNIPGLHIVRDKRNRKILTHISGSYSGYLTLYNKYDASGFSKNYALSIKKGLTEKGYKLNSWEYGAVGDDRFTYYVDFPVSVIYENGFISHPVEEANCRDPYYIDGIVRTQYDSMLKTFREIGGVDISGDTVKKTGASTYCRVNLLKLSRLAIYYIKSGQAQKSARIIRLMKKRYGKYPQFRDTVRFYSSIQGRIDSSERLYRKGLRYKKKRWHKTARRYFKSALAKLNRNSLYYGFKNRYKCALWGKRAFASKKSKGRSDIENITKPLPLPVILTKKYVPKDEIKVNPSSITKPAIIAIEEGDLNDAVTRSLAPDEQNLGKIVSSMKNYSVSKWKKRRYWSKKRKRRVTKWDKISKKFNFKSGIYIVRFNRDFTIASAKKVSSVYLDENRYQNQQFLKNSYFGQFRKERSL